jgi:hypothetical protein
MTRHTPLLRVSIVGLFRKAIDMRCDDATMHAVPTVALVFQGDARPLTVIFQETKTSLLTLATMELDYECVVRPSCTLSEAH